MEQLPTSLNYTASKSVIKYKRHNVRTTSTNSGGSGSVFRFRLPNGLINLSSFALAFDLKISGLDDNADARVILEGELATLEGELATLEGELALLTAGTQPYIAKQAEITAKEAEITAKEAEIDTAAEQYSNVKLPLSHKLIREIKVFVNNQQVSAQCSDYDLFYVALYKATVSDEYVKSTHHQHGYEMIHNADDIGNLDVDSVNIGDTSKSASYLVSNFMGIFNSGLFDTSLFGSIELEFIINEKYCLAQYVKGTGSNDDISLNVSNVEAFIDKVVEISPVYNKMVNMMLSTRKEPLYYCYQNFCSQINSTGKMARLQCRSQCIDAVVCFPLSSNYLNSTATMNPASTFDAPRYQFNSGKTRNRFDLNRTKNVSLQMTINGNNYPDVPINNAMHVAQITTQSLSNGSINYKSLLFNGQFQDYSDFLKQNFIWYNSLCGGEEGYVSKVMTGYDTLGQSVEIIVNHDCIATGGSLFIGALMTSCLSLDPVTKTMTVIE